MNEANNGWQPIDAAPVTTSKDDPYGRIRCLFYSKQFGVAAGDLIRFWQNDHAPIVQIATLHGDAVEHWGVTHWMPLPPPPSEEEA